MMMVLPPNHQKHASCRNRVTREHSTKGKDKRCMGPVLKAWLSVGAFTLFAIVSVWFYLVFDTPHPRRLISLWPTIIANGVAAGAWYAYVSTLKCRNCGASFATGAWGIGGKCRKCGQ